MPINAGGHGIVKRIRSLASPITDNTRANRRKLLGRSFSLGTSLVYASS